MAYEYKNIPVLSKIKIGENTYWLKDAELRSIVDAFQNSVEFNVNKTFDATREELATEKAIATWLEGQIAGLTGAMHFVGVVTKTEGESDLDALNRVVTAPESGDIAIVGTKEYVYNGAAWQELGDEGTHASKAYVDSTFVPKTLTVAGIGLDDAITVEELQTALQLGALAYKANASVTLNDYVTGLTAAEYTPAGDVDVELSHTPTAMTSTGNFTPAGGVSGTVIAKGNVALAKDNTDAGFAVSGSISTPNITVTPTTIDVQHIDDLGRAATWTGYEYTDNKLTTQTGSFATTGMTAAVDSANEMLTFSEAALADALNSATLSAGSVNFGTFDGGAAPTFGTEQKVLTAVEAALASAPQFTGDKISASFSGISADIAASFSGTQGAVSVSGSYDKASSATGEFTGTKANIAPTLVKGDKIVTVQ